MKKSPWKEAILAQLDQARLRVKAADILLQNNLAEVKTLEALLEKGAQSRKPKTPSDRGIPAGEGGAS